MGITETERVLQIVGDLDRLVVGIRDPILRRVGLSREQWQLLRLLADGQGHTMGEISDIMGLAGATATRVVDSLTENMHAYRRSDPLDRRRVLIHLAEPGQDILNQIDAAMIEQVKPWFDNFERGEQADLARLLEQVVSTAVTRPVEA